MTDSPELAVEDFTIPLAKLHGYLLCETHPSGRSKAKFFLGWGFDANGLATALFEQVEDNRRNYARLHTPYGDRFVITSPLRSPRGKTPSVKSIWERETGEQVVKLISAYPS